jgi:dihydroorotase
MKESFDLLVRGGTVATPNGIALADAGVLAGRIAAIGSFPDAKAATVFEAKGLHVLPGVMDTQVHFREPGNSHKEDLAAAAAILGGTAVSNPQHHPAHHHPRRVEDGWRAPRAACIATPCGRDTSHRAGELERCPGFAASRRSWFLHRAFCSTKRPISGGLKAGSARSRSIPRTKTA